MPSKKEAERKIPGVVILIILIGVAIAFGIYGLQLARLQLSTNTTALTPVGTGGNTSITSNESVVSQTPAGELTSTNSTSIT